MRLRDLELSIWPKKKGEAGENLDTSLRHALRYALPRVWATSRPHAIMLIVSSVLASLMAPVSLVVMAVLLTHIQEAVDAENAGIGPLVPWILLGAAAGILGSLCGSIRRYSKLRLGEELGLRTEREYLAHSNTLDLQMREDKTTQDIMQRGREATGLTAIKLVDGLVKVVSTVVQVVGLAGVMFWIEPVWSIVLVLLGLPFLFSQWVFSRLRYELLRAKTAAQRWARYYAEKLTNRETAPSIKVLGIGNLMLDKHETIRQEVLGYQIRLHRIQVCFRFGTSVITVLGIAVGALIVGHHAMTGVITLGEFAAFWVATGRFRTALTNSGAAFAAVWDAQLSVSNLQEFFRLQPIVVDDGAYRPEHIRGDIRVEHLSFSYPRAARPVLEDVSMTIRQGETVAIVGQNGSGKTTLVKLLARFYDPSGGTIHIDDRPLADFDLEHLHRRIALVFQTPGRFEASAADNIALGDWDRLAGKPELIRQIATAARVHDLIQDLPEGYDTLLGRMFGDIDLSGGQWQKLAIARALACNPSLVILDEPAANLDVQAEHAIYQGIRELIRDRTTILISHRFSTVRMADRVFVLDEGRIVEQGTHDELIALGGEYAGMYRTHEATLKIKEGESESMSSWQAKAG